MVNNELEAILEKEVVAYLGYRLGICSQSPRNSIKYIRVAELQINDIDEVAGSIPDEVIEFFN
jgi:hypothetical protein